MLLSVNQWLVASGQWSGKKVALLFSLLGLLSLSACGFKPVYGTASGISEQSPIRAGIKIVASGAGVGSSSNNVSVDESANRAIIRQFTQNMEDIVADSDAPTYKLEVVLSQSIGGLGVARDGTASRYNLTVNSSYRLVRLADNKLVDSGAISNVTSYNNPNNKYFSTYISEQDARKRGVKELAEMYRQRLIAFSEKIYPPKLPLSTPPPINENCPEVC